MAPSFLLVPSIRLSRYSSRGLVEDRVCLCDRERAVFARLDVLNRDTAGCGRRILVFNRDRNRALADLGIDGDAALDRDGVLDPRLHHADFAVGRPRAVARKLQADGGLPVLTDQLDVGDAGLGLKISEAGYDRNGDAVDRGQLERDALLVLGGCLDRRGRRNSAEEEVDAIFAVWEILRGPGGDAD